MKVSVVVPVYNLQNELKRCVNSILAQTHRDIEVLLVDDGSTDGSRGIICELEKADKRVVPIYKENGGVTSARLAGVERAAGEWIGFVDGDDIIEPDMYELLLANAQKYDGEISHCGYQMRSDDGRVSRYYGTGCLLEQTHISGIRDLLDGALIEPSLCNKIYRRSLFDNLLRQGMDTSIRINEDLLMNYYLFSAAKKSVFEDVCKYHYLVRGTSASRAKINEHRIMDPVRVKKIILDDCGAELKDDALRVYLRTCIYSYNSVIWERAYKAQKQTLRGLLREHRESFSLLPPKQRLMAEMIVRTQGVYVLVYPVYEKLLQKKRYC